MAGRPGQRSGGANRQSARAHQLRGTYRADRHGPLPPEEPPETEASSPLTMPNDLLGPARRHWKYFAPLLQSARLLTPSDIQTLADYCRACAAVDDRDRRLAAVMRKRRIDWALQNRLDRALRGWIERKTRLANELGLTATARSRVGWTGFRQSGARTAPDRPPSKVVELQQRAAVLRRPLGVKAGPA